MFMISLNNRCIANGVYGRPMWKSTLTAPLLPLANAMIGAAKISINHIDRRIGLIGQSRICVLLFSDNRVWLVSRFYIC